MNPTEIDGFLERVEEVNDSIKKIMDDKMTTEEYNELEKRLNRDKYREREKKIKKDQ